MMLTLTESQCRFRDQVRDFFECDYPRDVLAKARRGQVLTRADQIKSQQALHARGWLGFCWPKQFGGAGWDAVEQYIFTGELERAGAPDLLPMGIVYLGPVLIAFGTAEQRVRWLPRILESRELWAQGYSEPEAGSDLASLSLRAEVDGDDYIVNGTKIWTSYAHWADWIFCLVRTSRGTRKQDGITFLCIDMRSTGISVHPIVTMNGSHELNRVTFDKVRVPMRNRIGEEGRAWSYANYLLQNERLSYAHIGRKRAALAELRVLVEDLLDDPMFAARLAELEIELEVLKVAVLRCLLSTERSARVSWVKIKCTQLAQRITELYVEAVGRNLQPLVARDHSDWASAMPAPPALGPLSANAYLFERSQTIYGGTSEIQKEIIWRHLRDNCAR